MKFLLHSVIVRLNFKPLFNSINLRENTRSLSKMSGITLDETVAKLNEFASLDLAEKWDNVGLLIEPHTPRPIKTIFLTNDLTESVLKEAVDRNSDLIVSYHPPIFQALKRITQKSWKERIVSICLENRIALYSPHTSWDSVQGGVNDWLIKSLPINLPESKPITPNPVNPLVGAGRMCTLTHSITIQEAIDRIKSHIGVDNLHVSLANDANFETKITSVAVCAGSGASLLKNIPTDLYITGEMSHHEVLDVVHNNSHVILCNHSNSERGFLKEFQSVFGKMLNRNDVEIIVSSVDCDPLKTF